VKIVLIDEKVSLWEIKMAQMNIKWGNEQIVMKCLGDE